MTATYWEIGRRIVDFEQGGEKRAEYGKELLQQLSVDLTSKFGRGFSVDNLETMRLFYQTYMDPKGVSQKSETLSRKFNKADFKFPLSLCPLGAGVADTPYFITGRKRTPLPINSNTVIAYLFL